MKVVYLVIGILLLGGCVTTRSTTFYVGEKEVAKINAYGPGKHSMKHDGNEYVTDTKTTSIFRDIAEAYATKEIAED